MTRNEFLIRIIRLGLLAFLSFVAVALGKKAVAGRDCSQCAGKGLCSGENDCSKY